MLKCQVESLIDLLPYKRWHRVTAGYDALRFPEGKREHTQLIA